MEATASSVDPSFKLGAYVESDVLSSFEYSRTFQGKDYLLPEIKLMFAVLSDGIECFQKYAGAKRRRCRRIFAETEAWIFSCDSQTLYSFDNVCQSLQLDPDYLRSGLKRWREQNQNGNGAQAERREAPRCRGSSRSVRIAV